MNAGRVHLVRGRDGDTFTPVLSTLGLVGAPWVDRITGALAQFARKEHVQ